MKKIEINKHEFKMSILLTFVVFVLFEPHYFSILDSLDKVFNVLKVIVTVGIVIGYSIKSCKFHLYIFLPIIYEFIVLISTYISSTSFRDAVVQMAYVVDFCLLTSIMLQENIRKYISVIYGILELFAFINVCSCFVYPNGLYINGNGFPCYFLGYRNTAYQYLLVMVIFSSLNSMLKHHRIGMRVLIDIVFGYLIFTIKTNSVTGSILGTIYLICILGGKIYKHVKARWIFELGITLSFLIVIMNIQNTFGFLITKLGRNITFTGRTFLWAKLLKYYIQHPVLGWGIVDMPLFTNIYWANQAHNQFLQILFQSGILGMIIFCSILFTTAYYFDRSMDNDYKKIFIVSMIVYMVSFQTEGSVLPVFYSLLIMMAENNRLLLQ